jgi:hypothetical protein
MQSTSSPPETGPQAATSSTDTSGGILLQGLGAGLVGGSVLALWFLLIDGTHGELFRTPAYLASLVLGAETVRVTVGLVALYSVVHFALWGLLGVMVSGALARYEVSWPVLMGVLLGFLLFDLVFYAGVLVDGIEVVQELGWPAVLAGNVMAGVGVFAYFHMVGATSRSTAWSLLTSHRLIREGVVSGLIGAGVVAVWFLVFDLARGEPFFTPGALGSVFFLGAESLDGIQVEFATVAGYTMLHVAAFIALGMAAAAVAVAAEKIPSILLAAVLAFAAFEAFFLAVLAIAAEFLLGPLAWWTIAVGNVLAAGAMAAYLWQCHPRLRRAVLRIEAGLARNRPT